MKVCFLQIYFYIKAISCLAIMVYVDIFSLSSLISMSSVIFTCPDHYKARSESCKNVPKIGHSSIQKDGIDVLKVFITVNFLAVSNQSISFSGKEDCSDQSHFQRSRAGEKASKYPRAKICSVSEHSDCQDDDGECDSGIGSYESETELSACSSPVQQETFDDQPFGCNKPAHSTDRPSSPEYIMPDKSHKSPLKRRNPDARIPEVKPFVCYSCNCGFSEVSSLRAHVRHSHPRKGIAVGDFRCAFCLGSFSSIELLHDHVRSHQLPESNGYQSESNRVATAYGKPKMSAKSLAFSIENICADTTPKSSPKHQVSHAYPSINSPHQSQLFNRMMMSSSPVSVRSSLASSLDRAYCSNDIHSHTDAFCQCHINMHHLYIR